MIEWNIPKLNDSIFHIIGQIKGTVVNWGMTLCDWKLDKIYNDNILKEDKPVGLVRSNLQEGRGQEDGRLVDDPRFYDDVLRSPPGGEDSPIPPNFSTDDLLQLLEVGQDMRRITRSIKHLCSTEQTLR